MASYPTSNECQNIADGEPMEVPQHRRISGPELAVLGFTLFYMSLSLLAAVSAKNEEFVFYFAVMVLLIAAAILLHFRIGLHPAALWGLSVWGAAHMAGGLMPIPDSWSINGANHVLYNWWLIPGLLKYDQLVHANGFGLVTWICWQGLKVAFASRGVPVKPTIGLLSLCVASGNGFGAANEVVEFFATLTLAGTNVGGYENTAWDLVSNLVGSVVAAIAIYVRDRA